MTDDEQTITTDHVRALLAAEDGAAKLGLIEGRVEVIDADRAGADELRGAFEVITRDELVDRLGADPSDEEVADQAATLTLAVHQIGG
jgi:hypothetical protein